MKVLILTNGDYGDYLFCKDREDYDYIICADNGMKHARALHIKPHLIVGDFDSGTEEDLRYFKSEGVSIEKFLPEKDETDTELAIDRAIDLGATSIDLWGGIGTRLDHTLGNLHLLYKALKQGVVASLHNSYNSAYLIQDAIELKGKKGDIVSLIPFSECVKGVYTQHLRYPLINGTFEMGQPYGVSNYMTEEKAKIVIEKGLLLIIRARD